MTSHPLFPRVNRNPTANHRQPPPTTADGPVDELGVALVQRPALEEVADVVVALRDELVALADDLLLRLVAEALVKLRGGGSQAVG